jgi:phage tail sheath protein FI
MPEYLAPGVYVEEVSYRSKVIQGVSTTTTGFIGPARFGPTNLEPEIITSLAEFERVYGGGEQLHFADGLVLHNYLWHAVRAFFLEGGRRLYVSRIFRPNGPDDGRARGQFPPEPTPAADAVQITARWPGAAGNVRVRFTLRLGQNVLSGEAGSPAVSALRENDVVWIIDQTSPISPPLGMGRFYLAEQVFDPVTGQDTWRFVNPTLSPQEEVPLSALVPSLEPDEGDQVRVVTVTVTVIPEGGGSSLVWDGLALDPDHRFNGVADSMTAHFASEPVNVALARSLPIIITLGDNVENGLDVLNAMFQTAATLEGELEDPDSSDVERSFEVLLEKGDDGLRPQSGDYDGKVDPVSNRKTGLKQFEDLEDISIVAAPGFSALYETDSTYRTEAASIMNLLIAHARYMKYRIVIIDSSDKQAISAVRRMKARINSTYAAFYYPWIEIADPITRRRITVPPSGAVAGIYARNDIERAVFKAPGNEVVNTAVGLETTINKAQQEVLNPESINCIRFFPGRGIRVWGARLATDDVEWLYVNLRRYFAYVERSIDLGTQWAVFEPNGPLLWDNVRQTIYSFLLAEWRSGALLGATPELAFFVRCDESTMSPQDLDLGRLVCEIGLAVVRPAEFVIFRIGQWTADSNR